MNRIVTILLLIFAALPLPVAAQSRDLNQAYKKEVFTDGRHKKMPYRLLSPKIRADHSQYPLVVFLHGWGERGDDNEKQLTNGASLFTNPANEDAYPAFVLFPQTRKTWTGNIDPRAFQHGAPVPKETQTEKTLMELINKVVAENPIDRSRIYLVGLSMGGIATYDLVCRYPDIFAAAVPICGAVNPDRLKNAKGVNFLIFHGDQDEEVPTVASREAFKTLDAIGATVKYVEFAGVGHECWSFAFNSPTFLSWLFQQEKTPAHTESIAEIASPDNSQE